MQTWHPIRIHDEVEALGHIGVVAQLNDRSVVLETFDGRTVHLPNSALLAAPIVNHSTRGVRRSSVYLVVDAGDLAALDSLSATVGSVASVNAEPSPRVLLTDVSPNQLGAEVQFWHSPSTAATTRSAVLKAVVDDLASRGHPASAGVRKPSTPPSKATADK